MSFNSKKRRKITRLLPKSPFKVSFVGDKAYLYDENGFVMKTEDSSWDEVNRMADQVRKRKQAIHGRGDSAEAKRHRKLGVG